MLLNKSDLYHMYTYKYANAAYILQYRIQLHLHFQIHCIRIKRSFQMFCMPNKYKYTVRTIHPYVLSSRTVLMWICLNVSSQLGICMGT